MTFIRFWGRNLKVPSGSFGPDSGSYKITTYTDTTVLTQNDFNQVHRMNSTSNKQFTLPEITTPMIGKWFILRKINTGYLAVAASGSDNIEDATPVSCNTTDTDSFIMVMAAALTKWEVHQERGQWSS